MRRTDVILSMSAGQRRPMKQSLSNKTEEAIVNKMANFDPNKYVPVSERLAKFYEAYPSGRIVTTMLANDDTTGLVIFKAEAFRSVDG